MGKRFVWSRLPALLHCQSDGTVVVFAEPETMEEGVAPAWKEVKRWMGPKNVQAMVRRSSRHGNSSLLLAGDPTGAMTASRAIRSHADLYSTLRLI